MAAAPINPPPPRTPDSLFDLSINRTVSNLWRPSIFTRVHLNVDRFIYKEPTLTSDAREAISSELKGRVVRLKNNTVRVIRAAGNVLNQASQAINDEFFRVHVDTVIHSVVVTGLAFGSIQLSKSIDPNYYTTIFKYYSNRLKYLSILANLSLPIIKSITPYNSAIYSKQLRLIIGPPLVSMGTILGINSKNTFLGILTKNYLANFLSNTNLGLSHLTSRFIRSDRRLSIKKVFIIGLNLISSSYLCSAAVKIAMLSFKNQKGFL